MQDSRRTLNFWGSLIVQVRTEKKLSQRRLATETGVSRSTLDRIETGISPGDIYTIERLLDHLGYELDAHPVERKIQCN